MCMLPKRISSCHMETLKSQSSHVYRGVSPCEQSFPSSSSDLKGQMCLSRVLSLQVLPVRLTSTFCSPEQANSNISNLSWALKRGDCMQTTSREQDLTELTAKACFKASFLSEHQLSFIIAEKKYRFALGFYSKK